MKDDRKHHLDETEKKEMDSFRANYDLFIAPIEEFLPKVANKDSEEAPRLVIIPQGLFVLPSIHFVE